MKKTCDTHWMLSCSKGEQTDTNKRPDKEFLSLHGGVLPFELINDKLRTSVYISIIKIDYSI